MKTVVLTEKLIYFLLRLIVFLLLSFFLLYSSRSQEAWPGSALALLALYLLSDLALLFIPEEKFRLSVFPTALFLFDTSLISSIIYLVDGFEGDLYLVYFLVIFMSAIQMKIWQSFLTGTVAAALYLILWERRADAGEFLNTSLLLRLPFFYIASFFAAFFAAKAKETEEKLEWEYRALMELADPGTTVNKFAGKLAAELTDPLTIMLGFSGDILKKIGPENPLHLPVQSIAREARRCYDFFQNLLVLSKGNMGSLDAVDVNASIEEALESLQAKESDGLLIRKELEAGLPIVRGEKKQIVLALSHLIQNALEAMPEGGALTLKTGKTPSSGEEVFIEITDTGKGIPESHRRRLFHPFFTTKENRPGAGLGLFVASTIVRRHDGRILMEMIPGRETRFTLLLPGVKGHE